jgi:hypothetical protein
MTNANIRTAKRIFTCDSLRHDPNTLTLSTAAANAWRQRCALACDRRTPLLGGSSEPGRRGQSDALQPFDSLSRNDLLVLDEEMSLKRRVTRYGRDDHDIKPRRRHRVLFDLSDDRLAFDEVAPSPNVIGRIVDDQQRNLDLRKVGKSDASSPNSLVMRTPLVSPEAQRQLQRRRRATRGAGRCKLKLGFEPSPTPYGRR